MGVKIHLREHPYLTDLLERVGQLTGKKELEEHRLRGVSRFDEGVDRSHHNVPESGAEALLREQVQRRLIVHRHLDAACARRANAFGQRQHSRLRLPRGVLVHTDEARKPLTRHEGVAYTRSDHTRRNQDHIDEVGGLDQPESHVVARREVQDLIGLQVGSHVLLEDLRHDLIGNEQQDHVGPRARICDGQRLKTILTGPLQRRIHDVAHDDAETRVP